MIRFIVKIAISMLLAVLGLLSMGFVFLLFSYLFGCDWKSGGSNCMISLVMTFSVILLLVITLILNIFRKELFSQSEYPKRDT